MPNRDAQTDAARAPEVSNDGFAAEPNKTAFDAEPGNDAGTVDQHVPTADVGADPHDGDAGGGPDPGQSFDAEICAHDSSQLTLCPANGACVDTTSNDRNCGACGHDCLEGTCAAGQCQAILLAQYVGNPEIIFVGSQAVYATTDSGYIGRANKDGSDLSPFARPGFASSAFSGTLLGEDADRVFFVRSAGSPIQLSYCASSSCDSTATAIGGQYVQFFAIDSANHKVFWIDYSPSQLWAAPSTGPVSGTPLPGGALASGSSGSRVFYVQGGVFFADGPVLKRIPAAGGTINDVTAGNGALTILGANSTRLFVFDGTEIAYVPLPSGDGAAPKPLIAASLSPNVDGHFAVDETTMYWVSNGAIESCEIDRCPTTLKTLPTRTVDRVEDVGVDDRAIYWVAASPGPSSDVVGATVWKLAK